MCYMLHIWSPLDDNQFLRPCSLMYRCHTASKKWLNMAKLLKNWGLIKGHPKGCLTSNFSCKLRESIWITYYTFGLLDWVEVWDLINGLNFLHFTKLTYLINFRGHSRGFARPQRPQNGYGSFYGVPTAMFKRSAPSRQNYWIGPRLIGKVHDLLHIYLSLKEYVCNHFKN